MLCQISDDGINVPYQAPKRYGKKLPQRGKMLLQLHVDNLSMKEHAEFVVLLDPALNPEDVAGAVYEKFGGFLCRTCGSPIVFDGQNGGGTPSLLCKKCRKKMSIWNTFELTFWKYKKLLSATLHYFYGSSVEKCSELYGLGKGLLDEVRLSLPTLSYSKNGAPEIVEYEGLKFAVITIDMMYKGRNGLMLGVCGGLKMSSLGNENTGEGLDEFFGEVEKEVEADRYVFVMDIKLPVAKKILEKWSEKAIIVLQSHSKLGDAYVYFFHQSQWYTLHLRTDTFSVASKKPREELLLAPGEIVLYEGLKGVSMHTSLRNLSDNPLKKLVEELILQLENVSWESKGRVDLVMRPKLLKLNALLKELKKRRNVDVLCYFMRLRKIIDGLISRYEMRIKRTVKRKIVNAWSALTLLKDDVNRLALALLKEPLLLRPWNKSGRRRGRKRRSSETRGRQEEEEKMKIRGRVKEVYRGPVENHSVPETALWILTLLKNIFEGKEVTTNLCEGTFGAIGLELRQGRSIYLERASTKVFLRRQKISTVVEWLTKNYPLREMGRRGSRGPRKQLRIGRQYEIVYQDRRKKETRRIIDILQRKGNLITAYCHLRKDVRNFKRSRVKGIRPL